MGQGMVRTGVLDRGANFILGAAGCRGGLFVALLLVLFVAMAVTRAVSALILSRLKV